MVKGITHILISDTEVQAFVGRNKANTKYKAYPNVCPQPETYPYSVVKLTGKVPIECKGSTPDTYDYRYNVLSFDKNYEACEELDRAVVSALSLPNGGTFNGVVFQDIRHVNTLDEYVNEYSLHVKISSFEATVNEDQAT
jgi:hypothetical protein